MDEGGGAGVSGSTGRATAGAGSKTGNEDGCVVATSNRLRRASSVRFSIRWLRTSMRTRRTESAVILLKMRETL